MLKKFLTLLLFLSLATCLTTLEAKKDTQKIGDYVQVAIPVSALLVTAYEKDWEGSLQLAKGAICTQVSVELLKRSISDTRPDGGRYSFPSGHTAMSFLGASFVHKRYGPYLGIPAYTMAAFVGATRLDSRKHWPKDVMAGALLGFFINEIFTTSFDKNAQISPILSNKTLGLSYSKSF